MGRRIQRTPEQIKAFADALEAGQTLEQARLAAGYSVSTSKAGKKGLPPQLLGILAQRLKPLEALGKSVTAEQQENIARGAAMMNVIERTDKGAASIKLLGQDRRVNMWTPDSVTGLVVLQAPQSLRPDALDLPSIEKELPEDT